MQPISNIYFRDLNYLNSYYKEFRLIQNYYRNSSDVIDHLNLSRFYKQMTLFNNYYKYYDDSGLFLKSLSTEYYHTTAISKVMPLFHLSPMTLEDQDTIIYIFEEYCKIIRPRVLHIVKIMSRDNLENNSDDIIPF